MSTLVIRLFGNAAVGIATGVLTLLVLLFGEIVPKTWAMYNNEKLALMYSGIIYFLMQILTPIIFVVDIISGAILRILHIDPNKRTTMTESELKTYVDVSHEDGVIEQEEKKWIYNVFDFGDSVAKDIMIPRIDMTTIDIEASYEDLLNLFRESMYTRIPVYEGDIDNIIGLIYVKDLLKYVGKSLPAKASLKKMAREAYFIPETKSCGELFTEMSAKKIQMAIVVDEYGGTAGILTLEDLVEAIMGNIQDEYDQEDEEISRIDDNTFTVDGTIDIEEIEELIGKELPEGDYETLAGFIIDQLQFLPKDGEMNEVEFENVKFTVLKVDERRIEKIKVEITPLPESEYDDDDDEDDD